MLTWLLFAANLAVFLFELSLGREIDGFVRRWGLVPADIALGPVALVTLLTSTFLHAGWLHLASNVVYLGVFGPPVERSVGPIRFAVIYLLSGLVGSLAYLVAQPTSETPAIGASGAIAGVIAAHLVLYPAQPWGRWPPCY